MRPILCATGTYNYALAKWLDEKLKPLSVNRYTISDPFFAEEIQNLVIDGDDILVSFDVTSLFTNVPLQETIEIIAEKAFVDNWFNVTHNLNITKPDLVQLLEVATMNQLFQFDGKLYEQIDDVAMGSPLGPLMANAFLCSIEEKLDQDNKLPEFYRRYVDDTFATMKNVPAAEDFLSTLNSCHPSINFTMELASDNRLPFIGMEVLKKGCKLETSVYRKPTNTGLLLHHQSHVDKRYKKSLLKTMLNRAFHLSSTWESLKSECEDLKMCEPKPPIISQQCVVYNFKCDLCDAEYVGYTSRQLHQRIDEHRYSAIGKHLKNDHALETIGDLSNNFSVLKKCNGKLDCLIYEMLFIKKKRPCLNTQSDSIRAKLFI
ncbi:uncharacterized protein [Montipora capricornis]|uniref:uncharacterized protein n=1 Tax=Montipora capricornis TaxID=246305 RepID=UPI0035F1C315